MCLCGKDFACIVSSETGIRFCTAPDVEAIFLKTLKDIDVTGATIGDSGGGSGIPRDGLRPNAANEPTDGFPSPVFRVMAFGQTRPRLPPTAASRGKTKM